MENMSGSSSDAGHEAHGVGFATLKDMGSLAATQHMNAISNFDDFG
jgi:hypothetical protein